MRPFAAAIIARPTLRLLVTGAAAFVALAFAQAASAAWPGANGKIYFVSYRGSFDTIWSRDADGSGLSFVYHSGTEYDRNIEISPGGKRIVFNAGPYFDGACTQRQFGCEVWALSLDDLHRVGSYGPASSCPAGEYCWAGPATWLDDDRLVFAETDAGATSERALDLVSDLTTPFAGTPPTDVGRDRLSPDGRKQVYLAPGPDGSNQVFVANADGTDPVMITSFTAPGSCPENVCAYNPQEVVWQSLPDATPPLVTPDVSGTAGAAGWYTSAVSLSWAVGDPESSIGSSTGCSAATVGTDTAGTTFTCTAANRSGLSTTSSVTIKRDATPPTISYTGNAGSYTVDQRVAIHCKAADALSGVASTTCADTSAPAWTFGLGAHSLRATAADVAGNLATGSATFDVVVTAGSLCDLTASFVEGSAKYQSLPRSLRAGADQLVATLCARLGTASPVPTAQQKARAIKAYKDAVTTLAALGWLTAGEAATLVSLSNGL
jgi:hypothetical protein